MLLLPSFAAAAAVVVVAVAVAVVAVVVVVVVGKGKRGRERESVLFQKCFILFIPSIYSLLTLDNNVPSVP